MFIFSSFTHICGYCSLLLLAGAMTAALYMLAELAEEFPSRAKIFMTYTLFGLLFFHFLLMLTGLSIVPLLIGMATHGAYFSMLQTFPFVDLISIRSGLSLLGLLASHWFWFKFFIDAEHDHHHRDNDGKYQHDMLQVFGFFVVMVWSVPCGLIVSLTVNENVLPGIRPIDHGGMGINSSSSSSSSSSGKKKTIFMSIFDVAADFVHVWTGYSGKGISRKSGGNDSGSYGSHSGGMGMSSSDGNIGYHTGLGGGGGGGGYATGSGYTAGPSHSQAPASHGYSYSTGQYRTCYRRSNKESILVGDELWWV